MIVHCVIIPTFVPENRNLYQVRNYAEEFSNEVCCPVPLLEQKEICHVPVCRMYGYDRLPCKRGN